MKIKGIAAC
jgi:hypothetical protein